MEYELVEKNYNYYVENHKTLVKKYVNKFIVIKDEKVVGSFDSFEDAYKNAENKYELGTFIIQECTKNINETTIICNSRVRIS